VVPISDFIRLAGMKMLMVMTMMVALFSVS